MNAMRPQFDSHTKAAFVVACLTLLISGMGFRGLVVALNVYLQKEPVDLRMPLSLIPTTLGPWKAVGSDSVFDAAMVETLGTQKYLDRRYMREGTVTPQVLHVHLAYYTGMIDTVPHVPDRCMVAGGLNAKTLPHNLPLLIDQSQWQPDPEQWVNLSTGEPYVVVWSRDLTGRTVMTRMPQGEFRLRTVEFEDEKQPHLRIYGGYFFIANGRMTPAPEGVKAMAFNLRERYAYYCKVQYVYASPNATTEQFLELVSSHLQALLPDLMRCLPDWAEVERRGEGDGVTDADRPVS